MGLVMLAHISINNYPVIPVRLLLASGRIRSPLPSSLVISPFRLLTAGRNSFSRSHSLELKHFRLTCPQTEPQLLVIHMQSLD